MRSKPDPVDQPERTAHYDCAILCNVCDVHCGNATQHYSTETVLLIFLFLQTNITVQMSQVEVGGLMFQLCSYHD